VFASWLPKQVGTCPSFTETRRRRFAVTSGLKYFYGVVVKDVPDAE
jgi:hypothetical protein